MKLFFLFLGCNIYSILINRLETSFKFIEENINIPTTTTTTTPTPTIPHNSSNIGTYETNYPQNNQVQITWFLSGGIKNNFVGARSEASIMKSQIDNIINSKYNSVESSNSNPNCASGDFVCTEKFAWDYILDEKSTNTAENFIWASQFLNTTSQSFDSIYVVTSAFHYNRARMMLNLIDPSKNFKWILGDLEEQDSRYWESVHINNVNADVSKAKTKLESMLQ